ncbi:MAG: metal ABC transporter permease [Lactobacillus sp.]|uniref:Metal ABC transporter permease n=1 Tax=Bombilactobacillus bombi TaxID=1303590 RepID=A0A347SU24_9LACO|nr:metal ABC transporter permease [Bombilactobacillus bombi]MCO6540851.1 metal ABC transporter permease [Lactobacillus sp.]AXX65533.1 metal ABC transporter permease [Bombilactobacillus bombi]MCO6542497.1 metal ABC transporter permease [Lactobacillus sp.]RHW44457.1 metal ABC transporter permease [Bombilactobacillus bombi]RHW52063.1 metal ABC transporter permease [Bombilactobacillus bombi]
MLQYEFMQNAAIVATVISILCGVIGVFITARHLSFLTHTMSEIGFSGASFGLWMGWTPLNGMLLFTILSALVAGSFNKNKPLKSTVISLISAFFMGLGVLFLSISQASSSYATNILFGSIVGISRGDAIQISLIAFIELIVIVLMYRQLKFDFFDPVGAQGGIRFSGTINLIFLMMMSLSVSIVSQIVGALLVFALLTLPAAAAQFWGKTVHSLIIWSIIFALIGTWSGLALGYWTNLPVTFFITTIETLIYLVAWGSSKILN